MRLVAELEQRISAEPTEDLNELRMAILTSMGESKEVISDADQARIHALGYPEGQTMRELYEDAVSNGEISPAE